MKWIRKQVSERERLETVLVLSLALLLIGLFGSISGVVWAAAALLAAGLLCRPLSRWLAICWLSLADTLGRAVSFLLLSLLFYLFVVPTAALSRLFGKVPPSLAAHKPSVDSFYTVRNHTFSKSDFEKSW